MIKYYLETYPIAGGGTLTRVLRIHTDKPYFTKREQRQRKKRSASRECEIFTLEGFGSELGEWEESHITWPTKDPYLKEIPEAEALMMVMERQ